jgi:hypothetical protein
MNAAMEAMQKRRAFSVPQPAAGGEPPADADGKPTPEDVTQPGEGAQSPADDANDDAALDTEGASAEGEEGVEGDEQGLDAASDDADDDAVVLTLDGEKLTKRDVRDGILRAADYTRKTQALAEKRRSVEEMEKKYAFSLGRMENAMVQEVERMKPPAELARSNPSEYAAQRALYEEGVAQLRQFQREGEELMQSVEARIQSERAEAAAHTNEVLRSKVPGWSNALYYELLNYAVAELGVPKQQALANTDPFFFIMLHKARNFDMARKTAQTKRVKAASDKTITPGRPATKATPKQSTATKAFQQARRSGKVDDALAALRARRSVTPASGALSKRGK